MENKSEKQENYTYEEKVRLEMARLSHLGSALTNKQIKIDQNCSEVHLWRQRKNNKFVKHDLPGNRTSLAAYAEYTADSVEWEKRRTTKNH